MRFDLVSIFPQYFDSLSLSLLGRADRSGLVSVRAHDLRDWAHGAHRSVDDAPYGGGAGMVMLPGVWCAALDEILGASCGPVLAVPTPSGTPLTQRLVGELARADHIVVACGRYEGIDARVAEHYRSLGVEVRELSIGDYVLSGGEGAALVMAGRQRPRFSSKRWPASSRASWATPTPWPRSPTGTAASWSTPPTPSPAASGGSTCPTCCSPATTAPSGGGGATRAF